ncbi:MAG: hypothetical protein ISP01_05330 [Methanobrevibacter arboriphilus]|uniref:Uncharacterized protein n=1 Tax=Methanobrevibacter arboriphilus TaxID=39441 RepID=A0A843APV3_METAZ|nr:hypothetical protein [Methanobrevibacter arboriphilus]MBF4468810.1 hypothetical protein [Methanobrevibacter arboriphilus]
MTTIEQAELRKKMRELSEDELKDVIFNLLNQKFEDREIISYSGSVILGIFNLHIEYETEPESCFLANQEVKKELGKILLGG